MAVDIINLTTKYSMDAYMTWSTEYIVFDDFNHAKFAVCGSLISDGSCKCWNYNHTSDGSDRVTYHYINDHRKFPGIADRPNATNSRIILKDSLKYRNRRVVKNAYWFHSSHNEYSDDWQKEPTVLHVGTAQAALYRRFPSQLAPNDRPYIHVFKIKDYASVSDIWLLDGGNPRCGIVDTVCRYVNAYEACGSVSIVGRTSLFEHVDTIETLSTKTRLSEMPKHVRDKIKHYTK